MRQHITDDEIAELDSPNPDAGALRHLVRHLLAGCPECRTRYGAEVFCRLERCPEGEVPEPILPIDYEPAIDAALEGALYWLGRNGQRLSPREFQGADELAGSARVEDFLARSFAARYSDPKEMVFLATLAQVAASNLDPDELGPEITADLRARTWGELGNAHRVADDLRAALEAFGRAAAFREAGTGDAALRARLLELYASYLNSTRYFDEACEILGAVEQLYRHAEDGHLAGRALVVRAIYEGYRGDLPSACLPAVRKGA